MGKVDGFMEYNRQLPKDRKPLERINNWNEFHTTHSDEKLKLQGARCMDCGVPFCHAGIILSGMAAGCPINNLIPEVNDLVYRGKWHEAYLRLKKTNNFPEFTGRVCPAPCEGSCVLGMNDPAVTIKNIEYSVIDRAFEKGWVKPKIPKYRTMKKIAIVGSGPAGLACAVQLNSVGHNVVVYERSDRIGGLLMYGIPNMKLEKNKVLKRRIDILEKEGINFVTNCEIGKDILAKDILKDYDAVVLCCGATKARNLPIEGRDAHGIQFAVEFLSKNTKSLLDSNFEDNNFISAKDKDVIVIGGGDTGTDCVATSIRHGCKSINQFEILPKPPISRADDNPWPEWPNIYTVDYGQEESYALYGRDPRHYQIMTKKFEKDENGNVCAVHTVQIEWEKDSNDKFRPKEISGTEKRWPAQLVLLALGFLGPEDKLIDQMSIDRDERSNISSNSGKYKTNIDKVFAAGDCRRGQSLVVWAIKEGRKAAKECDKYLMGDTILP